MGQPAEGRYRTGLRTAVREGAAPYGYTLSVWGGGAALAAGAGLPSAREALTFVAAAVLAFIAVGAAAFAGARQPVPDTPSPFSWHQWLDLPVIVAPVAGAAALGRAFDGWWIWPIAGAAVTVLYLAGAGGQLALAQLRHAKPEADADSS